MPLRSTVRKLSSNSAIETPMLAAAAWPVSKASMAAPNRYFLIPRFSSSERRPRRLNRFKPSLASAWPGVRIAPGGMQCSLLAGTFCENGTNMLFCKTVEYSFHQSDRPSRAKFSPVLPADRHRRSIPPGGPAGSANAPPEVMRQAIGRRARPHRAACRQRQACRPRRARPRTDRGPRDPCSG